MQAARGGQMKWVAPPKQKWESHDISGWDNEGFSPLHYAVQYQRVDDVERLLQAKRGKLTRYYINCIHDIVVESIYVTYMNLENSVRHPMLRHCIACSQQLIIIHFDSLK